MEKLDQAWEAINALGGADVQDNSYDQGIVDTVKRALDIIEALGGMDPKQRTLALTSTQSGGAAK
jgi:hypothetical protein